MDGIFLAFKIVIGPNKEFQYMKKLGKSRGGKKYEIFVIIGKLIIFIVGITIEMRYQN